MKIAATFLIALTFFLSLKGFCSGDLSLVGSDLRDRSELSDHPNSKFGKPGFGGGILFESRSRAVGIELGLIYSDREIFDSDQNQYGTTAIQLPVLLRLHLVDWFTLGAGVFGENYLGSLKINGRNVGSYRANGYSEFNYGAIGSVAIRLPLSESVHLIFDFRYLYGVDQQFVTLQGAEVKLRDLQALAGFQFGL